MNSCTVNTQIKWATRVKKGKRTVLLRVCF